VFFFSFFSLAHACNVVSAEGLRSSLVDMETVSFGAMSAVAPFRDVVPSELAKRTSVFLVSPTARVMTFLPSANCWRTISVTSTVTFLVLAGTTVMASPA